jgi:two-component system, OmpR family, sensor kinase
MKLYLRIWLAIVVTVTAVVFVVGFFWKNHTELLREEFRGQMREQIRLQAQDSAGRELEVLDENGRVVGRAKPPPPRRTDAELAADPNAQPRRRTFELKLDNGQKLEVLLPGRPPRMQRSAGPPPPWYFSPWGFVILLAAIALAVAIGAYPIVRRLTKRLETLQSGVERWGAGHLSERVPVEGRDEVAFLAAKFNHAAAQVETLLASHKALLANASHELRSPLARIRMGIEVGDTSEIKRNIAELDSLIEEILLASRLDAADSDIESPESFDLMGLAAEECARTGALLDVAADSQGQFEMQGHPKLVRRLLRNLLENAAKYNDASKGQVTLLLDHDGADISITVRDHGLGVASTEALRIFEPFYRAKNASERDGGVGLGLSLVQSIAKRHGGSATCIPCDGVTTFGGCFLVRLQPKLQPK